MEPLQHQERFAALNLQVSCACSPSGVSGHEPQLPATCAPLGSAGKGLLSPHPEGSASPRRVPGLPEECWPCPAARHRVCRQCPSFLHNQPEESCQQCSMQQETPAAPPLPCLLLAVLMTVLTGQQQSPRASLSLW